MELLDLPMPEAWTTCFHKPMNSVSNIKNWLPQHLFSVCLPIFFLSYRIWKAKLFPSVLCDQSGHLILTNEEVPGEGVPSQIGGDAHWENAIWAPLPFPFPASWHVGMRPGATILQPRQQA